MANTPNDILKESISALVDGETDDFDLRRVLKEAENSPAVRETWRRYHLIGAAMRGELGASTHRTLSDADLAARIRGALSQPPVETGESEPGVAVGQSASVATIVHGSLANAKTTAVARWWEGAGKASIAATVALGVLLGAQQFGETEPTAVDPIADVDLPSDQSATVFAPAGFQIPYHSAQHASVGSQPTQTTSYLNSTRYRPVTLRASRVASDQELQDYLNHVLLKHVERSSAAGGLGMVPVARVSRLDTHEAVRQGIIQEGSSNETGVVEQQ